MAASDFDPELERLRERSIVRLLSADVFDAAAFDQLYDYLASKADEIKQEHVVSKQVVSCLLAVEGPIRSQADYLPAAREGIPLIAKFAMLLGLIAIGESPRDREAGQPRII